MVASRTVLFHRHIALLARPTQRWQHSSFPACAANAAATAFQCRRQHAAFSTNAKTSSRTRTRSKEEAVESSTRRTKNAPSLSKDDWRTWFRSSDYDDPWSPYYPLERKQQINSINRNDDNSAYQKTIVSSVLDGAWERRRHGMNLEPLQCKMQPTRQLYKHPVTENDREEKGILQEENSEKKEEEKAARAKMIRMDSQTRFLCRMLDDLYRTGIWREVDRPTTERCHRTIGRLLTMTPKDTPERNENDSQSEEISYAGLAQRAGAILERMEQCSPEVPRAKSNTQQSSDEPKEQRSNDNDNTATLLSALGSYQNHPSKHLSRTKFVLPHPTQAIYNMVLLSYAKESGPVHIAEQAEDVVWSMISRATRRTHMMQHLQIESKEDGAGDSELLFPSVENWNCVLKCWSLSTDADRSFRSYSFLLSWMEWNEKFQEELQGIQTMGRTHGDEFDTRPNSESFQLVLQSCLVEDHTNEFKAEQIQRAKEMGSGVAVRLWKEMLNNSTIDSVVYHQMVQAICQTSDLPSSSSSNKALQALARVYARCHEEKMVTPEIFELVKAATTESQFARILQAT